MSEPEKRRWTVSYPNRVPNMVVERVSTEHGSTPNPPYDHNWSDLDQLRWTAGLTAVDENIDVGVEIAQCSGYGPRQRFNVLCGASSCGPYLAEDAARIINGIGIGAREARRENTG